MLSPHDRCFDRDAFSTEIGEIGLHICPPEKMAQKPSREVKSKIFGEEASADPDEKVNGAHANIDGFQRT